MKIDTLMYQVQKLCLEVERVGKQALAHKECPHSAKEHLLDAVAAIQKSAKAIADRTASKPRVLVSEREYR